MISTTTSTTRRSEPSFGELLKELTCETRDLVQAEIALAKTELTEKAEKVGRNLAYLAAGGLVAFGGFLTLLGAMSYGLMELLNEGMSQEIAIWLAPLIVAVVVLVIGYAFIHKAIASLKRESLAPRKTIETLRENKQWLQDRMT